jgi:coenzyme F420-reducing hydrogenase delta subunit
VEQTRKLLEQIGLPGQRLQMINISSAMAGQFAFAAAELTAEVQRLGPSPVRPEARRALPAEVIEQEEAAEG